MDKKRCCGDLDRAESIRPELPIGSAERCSLFMGKNVVLLSSGGYLNELRRALPHPNLRQDHNELISAKGMLNGVLIVATVATLCAVASTKLSLIMGGATIIALRLAALNISDF